MITSNALQNGPREFMLQNSRFAEIPYIWYWKEEKTHEDTLRHALQRLGFDFNPNGWNAISGSSGKIGLFLPKGWKYSSDPMLGITDEHGIVIGENGFTRKSPNAEEDKTPYAHFVAQLRPPTSPDRIYFIRELIEEKLAKAK